MLKSIKNILYVIFSIWFIASGIKYLLSLFDVEPSTTLYCIAFVSFGIVIFLVMRLISQKMTSELGGNRPSFSDALEINLLSLKKFLTVYLGSCLVAFVVRWLLILIGANETIALCCTALVFIGVIIFFCQDCISQNILYELNKTIPFSPKDLDINLLDHHPSPTEARQFVISVENRYILLVKTFGQEKVDKTIAHNNINNFNDVSKSLLNSLPERLFPEGALDKFSDITSENNTKLAEVLDTDSFLIDALVSIFGSKATEDTLRVNSPLKAIDVIIQGNLTDYIVEKIKEGLNFKLKTDLFILAIRIRDLKIVINGIKICQCKPWSLPAYKTFFDILPFEAVLSVLEYISIYGINKDRSMKLIGFISSMDFNKEFKYNFIVNYSTIKWSDIKKFSQNFKPYNPDLFLEFSMRFCLSYAYTSLTKECLKAYEGEEPRWADFYWVWNACKDFHLNVWDAKSARRGEIWQGASRTCVRLAWGKPDNKSIVNNWEYWHYSETDELRSETIGFKSYYGKDQGLQKFSTIMRVKK